MKAFLLAGGYGTRLRPLTDSIPKCLAPIRGRPLLDIWLALCARSGITEVLVNLHAHKEAIERHLKDKRPPVSVRLVHEERLLGSAGTIAANREWVGSEAAFWILYSDVLTNMDLRLMASFHARHDAAATLGLYQVREPSQCGVALADDAGLITEFEEKPEHPRGDWVFSGIMMAGPQLFDSIPADVPADIGFHVLPRLLGKMRAYRICDYLIDIGSRSNYEKAQATWPGEADPSLLHPGQASDCGGRISAPLNRGPS